MRNICLKSTRALLSILFAFVPMFLYSTDNSGLRLEELTFVGNEGDTIVSDIGEVRFYFKSRVDVGKDAKAYIMLGDEVMAETEIFNARVFQETATLLTVNFSPSVRLPKGHDYKLMLSAGAVHDHFNASLSSEEIAHVFFVPDGFIGHNSMLHDGCSLSSLHIGGFDFGAIETEKADDAKIFLYREGVLVSDCRISVWHGSNKSHMNFDFGKRILLDEGVGYTLVLPEGSVRSMLRDDIVNKEMRINIIGRIGNKPVFGEENSSGLVPYDCSLMYNDGLVFYDIDNAAISFTGNVSVKTDAMAYIMLGDEVMAVADKIEALPYGNATSITVKFGAPVRLPKGNKYKFVLPADTFFNTDGQGLVSGKLSYDFFVPGDFEATCENPIYDGCNLASLENGELNFGKIETQSVEGANLYLYHGEELSASCPANAYWDFGRGGMHFDFGSAVKFDEGEHYVLVLPAGSVRTRYREDIVNKELRINIYGPKSGTDVSSATSSAVSISCNGSMLRVSGADEGTPIEVFTAGGSMVRSCKAQSGGTQIALPGKGCYVVRVGGKTKVVYALF